MSIGLIRAWYKYNRYQTEEGGYNPSLFHIELKQTLWLTLVQHRIVSNKVSQYGNLPEQKFFIKSNFKKLKKFPSNITFALNVKPT